jgi:hypothetical protein
MPPEELKSPEESGPPQETGSPEESGSTNNHESTANVESPEEQLSEEHLSEEHLSEEHLSEEHPSEDRENVLGRLIDPDALATCSGARGKLCIEVPGAWLVGAVELLVTAPARIVCARCDGGGCDGCGRSGALRGPVEEAARTLSVHLPDGSSGGALLRLVRPFGVVASIEQLLIEVRPAGHASAGVARVAPAAALAGAPRFPLRGAPWVFLILAAIAALIALVAARSAR